MAAFDAGVPPDLQAFMADSNRAVIEHRVTEDIPKIRLDAIKEAALGYGVKGGLARRSYEINKILLDNRQMLDGMFRFSAWMMDKNVMPPVVTLVTDPIHLADPDTIRAADVTYKIERQATFVLSPPNWRDYLVTNYKYQADAPAAVLYPKSDIEKKLWDKYVGDGWKIGVTQANEIYGHSLARLKRDFLGMATYKFLYEQGKIGKPYVSQANLGVTSDGNTMSVNDRVTRIILKPQFEANPNRWTPVMVPR